MTAFHQISNAQATHLCGICRIAFLARPGKKYCSDTCNRTAYKRRARSKGKRA